MRMRLVLYSSEKGIGSELKRFFSNRRDGLDFGTHRWEVEKVGRLGETNYYGEAYEVYFTFHSKGLPITDLDYERGYDGAHVDNETYEGLIDVMDLGIDDVLGRDRYRPFKLYIIR